MPGLFDGVYVTNAFGLVMFLVLWIVLCEFAQIVLIMLRQEPLIGWGIGPSGLTFMVLREPSLVSIWLDVLFPALVSGSILYVGLFTAISPFVFPNQPFLPMTLLLCGVLLTSASNIVTAFRDLRYPLWGEARVLQTIQVLRTPWSKIYFTPFGYSYVRRQFGFNPPELLQSISL